MRGLSTGPRRAPPVAVRRRSLHNPPMTHRPYKAGLVAGLILAIALAAWRLAIGAGLASAFLWAVGGLAAALIMAALADLGMRLQRRDVPHPSADDLPDERVRGRFDEE